MKILGLVAIAAAMGVNAPAGERSVTVCMKPGAEPPEMYLARADASKIFERIGVRIDWRRKGPSCIAAGTTITITLSPDTPQNRFPNAFAYARPYEGIHIVLFYDRVRQTVERAIVPSLLAYVMVHEIVHILQGTQRHSEGGIMKARWDGEDYSKMRQQSLGFAEGDVDLIYAGLDWREAHRTATNTSPSPLVVR